MSDAALRGLERAWRASGSVETEAALLQAQLRAGVLLERRVQLAACLGHPAAVTVSPPATLSPLLSDWCFELTEFGKEVIVRVAVAAARPLLERFDWAPPLPDPSPLLQAVEGWVVCPCPEHVAGCLRASEAHYAALVTYEGEPDLGVVLHQTDRSRPLSALIMSASLAARGALDDDARPAFVQVVTDIAEVLGEEDDLRLAIRDEVVPWTLGRRDVVREQVDARFGRQQDYVTFFGQRMRRDWAEALEQTQRERAYRKDGERYPRIPYGSETFRVPREAASRPCRHCNTLLGKLHEPNCDYEQCPACNDQIMSCDCEFEGHEWRDLED